jgi:hypothetical protein
MSDDRKTETKSERTERQLAETDRHAAEDDGTVNPAHLTQHWRDKTSGTLFQRPDGTWGIRDDD